MWRHFPILYTEALLEKINHYYMFHIGGQLSTQVDLEPFHLVIIEEQNFLFIYNLFIFISKIYNKREGSRKLKMSMIESLTCGIFTDFFGDFTPLALGLIFCHWLVVLSSIFFWCNANTCMSIIHIQLCPQVGWFL